MAVKNVLKSVLSVTNEGKHKIVKILGLKLKFKRDKYGILMNEIRELKNEINWVKHPLHCINRDVNTIFQYMSGLQLTKNYQTERVVAFDIFQAPRDHFERYFFVEKLIEDSDEVLDIACGTGYGTAFIAGKALNATGVDISEPAINFANKFFNKENLSFLCADAAEIDFGEKFDKIISFETIEHIDDDEKFIKNLYKLLKDDGKLICSVPNETIFPYNEDIVPFHVRHYTVHDLSILLQKCGFRIEDIYFQYAEEKDVVMKKSQEGYTTLCIARKDK